MKITKVDVTSCRRTYEAEIYPAWSPGTTWTGAHTTIYRVHTDEGVTGIGASGGSPELAREVIAPRLIDRDPFNVEHLTRMMRNTGGGHASLPIACGIEMALWDIIGKVAGLAALPNVGRPPEPRPRLRQHGRDRHARRARRHRA